MSNQKYLFLQRSQPGNRQQPSPAEMQNMYAAFKVVQRVGRCDRARHNFEAADCHVREVVLARACFVGDMRGHVKLSPHRTCARDVCETRKLPLREDMKPAVRVLAATAVLLTTVAVVRQRGSDQTRQAVVGSWTTRAWTRRRG
jgi:hypothetical protein